MLVYDPTLFTFYVQTKLLVMMNYGWLTDRNKFHCHVTTENNSYWLKVVSPKGKCKSKKKGERAKSRNCLVFFPFLSQFLQSTESWEMPTFTVKESPHVIWPLSKLLLMKKPWGWTETSLSQVVLSPLVYVYTTSQYCIQNTGIFSHKLTIFGQATETRSRPQLGIIII